MPFDSGSPPVGSAQNLCSRYTFRVIRHRHYFVDQEYGWYWSLKFDDERINGGIATDWEDGQRRALRTMVKDEHDRFLATYFYDSEDRKWLLKSMLEHK
jgi:hypothetical protein